MLQGSPDSVGRCAHAGPIPLSPTPYTHTHTRTLQGSPALVGRCAYAAACQPAAHFCAAAPVLPNAHCQHLHHTGRHLLWQRAVLPTPGGYQISLPWVQGSKP
eukprot:804815-Pelagomonas_calceolata.AAC.18